MKKIEYKAPKMENVKIELPKFICGSGEIGGGGGHGHAPQFELDDIDDLGDLIK